MRWISGSGPHLQTMNGQVEGGCQALLKGDETDHHGYCLVTGMILQVGNRVGMATCTIWLWQVASVFLCKDLLFGAFCGTNRKQIFTLMVCKERCHFLLAREGRDTQVLHNCLGVPLNRLFKREFSFLNEVEY